MIDERPCDGIEAFFVDAPDRVCLVGNHFDPLVFERNPEPGTESVALEIPPSFLSPLLGSRAGMSLKDQSVVITTEADSCHGELFGFFRARDCRIKESNEKNNRMEVQLRLSTD